MSWQIFQTEDLTHPHTLRREVFMGEQGITEAEEMDDLDDLYLPKPH